MEIDLNKNESNWNPGGYLINLISHTVRLQLYPNEEPADTKENNAKPSSLPQYSHLHFILHSSDRTILI